MSSIAGFWDIGHYLEKMSEQPDPYRLLEPIERNSSAPLVVCLLALAKESLSAGEICAVLSRDLSQRQAEFIRRRYDLDPVENRHKMVEQALSELGGMLHASTGTDLQSRFRLSREDIRNCVLNAQRFADSVARMQELLALQAAKPGTDAASSYLFRHGIAHIIEAAAPDRRYGAEEAARLLANFDYQLQRLATVADTGGDGGIREDWMRVQNAISDAGGSLEELPRAWRQFWATDGTLFEAGEGRDAVRELLERVLEYAPNTIIGASYGSPKNQ